MRRWRGGKDASASNHWLVRTTGGSIERSTPSLEITMAARKKAAKKSGRKSAKKAGAKKGGARKKAAKKGAKKAARRK
jgi:hypothetical protein